MTASAAALAVRDLTVQFGPLPALHGVSFHLEWGDRLAVFGPNGAGKTTLLRVLAGLLRPTSGQALVAGGRPHEHPGVRRLIGVVAHQTYLHDELTVTENLTYYGRLYGVADLPRRVGELIEAVGLAARRDERVARLSRGLQQRLAIARALLHDPPVLLLDEPDTGLDPLAFGALEPLLVGPAERPRTIVAATHDLELGLALGKRLIILAAGRVVADRRTAELGLETLRRLYQEVAPPLPPAAAASAGRRERER